MKKAVINSVCASLNTDGTISDAQATHVLPPMTKVLGDDIIEDKLNHIQSQLRRKRDDSGSETKRDHTITNASTKRRKTTRGRVVAAAMTRTYAHPAYQIMLTMVVYRA